MLGVEGVGQRAGQVDERLVDLLELTGGALGLELGVDAAPDPCHRALASPPDPG